MTDAIFIWIPKTAGTAIYQVLQKHGCPERLWRKWWLNQAFIDEGFCTFGHIDIQACLSRNKLDRDYYERAFKFCFVRNPWDRMVSLYSHVKQHSKARRRYLKPKDAFEDFLCLLQTRSIVPKIGYYNVSRLNAANNQVKWIFDKSGNQLVDFIGRFENLNEDSQYVFSRLGVEESLEHVNKTDHPPYQEMYTDKTRETVRRMYREDIEAFEYEF